MTLLRSLPRRLPALLFAAAVLGPLTPSPLHAAENLDFAIDFGAESGADLGASFRLRPTVQQQELYVYVLNKNKTDEVVTVEVLAGLAEVAGTKQLVSVKANSRELVKFGKAAPAEPPAPAAPAAPAAPPAKPMEPALQEAKGPLQVAVLDKEGKETLATAPLAVARPDEYVQVTDISFSPEAQNGDPKNTLTVRLKALGGFGSPASRVELVLRPDRIPGLVDSPRKEGTRVGFLGPKGELTLKAENIQFEEGVRRANGLVYLTVDGWERAFTYYTSFPTDGGQAGQPTPIRNVPVVRMTAPEVWNPGKPLPVELEVDNAAGMKVALGFDRDADGNFSADNDEVQYFNGDRQVKMLAGVDAAKGCLLLQPEVHDWKKEWKAEGIFGTRTFQAQVLKNATAVDVYNSADATRAASFDQWTTKTEITQSVRLDGAPPEGVKLAFPATLKRGADLPVQATSADKPSDIKEVFFYAGKPGPDGAPPPTAVKVPGVWDAENKLYAAVLPAPTDQKGKVDVTVTFVKFTNVSTNGTVTVQLEDPTPATPTATNPGGAPGPKGGSIEGAVVEGGLGQPNLEVRLYDDKNAVKDAVKTDANGKYAFKDVAAGSYRVAAVKTTDSTKGETAAMVMDGKKLVGVDVKLQR